MPSALNRYKSSFSGYTQKVNVTASPGRVAIREVIELPKDKPSKDIPLPNLAEA